MSRWTMEDIEKKGLSICQMEKKYSAKQAKNIPASFALGRLKAGNMNKTEAAYSKYLETLKHVGEILWFEF